MPIDAHVDKRLDKKPIVADSGDNIRGFKALISRRGLSGAVSKTGKFV